jgi:hypothetical protein
MIPASWFPLADANQISYAWRNAQSNTDLIIPGLLFLAAVAYVVYMYRRDAAELHPLWAALLTLLRTATFVALLILYFYPQRRSDQDKTYNSRVFLLVDTSRSMTQGNTSDDGPGKDRRIDRVVDLLQRGEFLDRLRETHDVTVIPFDDELRRERAVTLPKFSEADEHADAADADGAAPADGEAVDAGKKQNESAEVEWAKALAVADANRETRLGQAVLQLLNEETGSPISGLLVFSDGGQNAGPGVERAAKLANQTRTAVLAVGVGPDRSPPNVRVAGFRPPKRAYPGDPFSVEGSLQGWRMEGQKINVQLLSRPANVESPGTGELLDGKEVELGRDGEQVSVKFEVRNGEIGQHTLCLKAIPPRSDRDPNDNFLEGDTEIVDTKSRILLLAGGPMRDYQYLCNQLFREIADKLLAADGPIRAEMKAAGADVNSAAAYREFAERLAKEGKIQKPAIACDVYLQGGDPVPLQAGRIPEEYVRDYASVLDGFPETAKEMGDYDCVVAFDPDWQALDVKQIDLLEAWVNKQGGGLLVVAGPVYAGQAVKGWVQDKNLGKLRELYPVTFQSRVTGTETTMEMGEEVWPLQFEQAGLDANFLALAESPEASLLAWQEFPGVYSYLPVRGAKEGAAVLSRFSDPRVAVGQSQPPYMAWHNFGSGRVFYLGSGEMWRLRAQEDAYFQRFYTKVMRHVSAGRLSSGSSRGMLLVEEERPRVGNAIKVRGYRLLDDQLRPLTAKSVTLKIISPDRQYQEIQLPVETGRPGFYSEQFTPLRKGPYRLRIDLPDGSKPPLTANVLVEGLSDLELDQPERNDVVLSTLAGKVATFVETTTGDDGEETEATVHEIVFDEKSAEAADENAEEAAAAAVAKPENPADKEQRAYFVGTGDLSEGTAAQPSVFDLLKDRTRNVPKPVIDRDWEEDWLRWMMLGLFVLLCLEWLIRRLLKLA